MSIEELKAVEDLKMQRAELLTLLEDKKYDYQEQVNNLKVEVLDKAFEYYESKGLKPQRVASNRVEVIYGDIHINYVFFNKNDISVRQGKSQHERYTISVKSNLDASLSGSNTKEAIMSDINIIKKLLNSEANFFFYVSESHSFLDTKNWDLKDADLVVKLISEELHK